MMLASTTSPGVPTQEDLKAYGDTATRLKTPKGFVSRTSSAFLVRGARAKEYFRRVLIAHPYMMSNKRSVMDDGWFREDYQAAARTLPYYYAIGVQEMNAMGWLGKLWYASTAALAKKIAQLAPVRAANGWGE